MAASQRERNDLVIRVLDEILRRRLQVEVNGLADIVQGFVPRATLRPATLQRGAARGKVAVFTTFDHDLECYGLILLDGGSWSISRRMRAVYSRLLEKMRLDRWRIFDRRYVLGKLTKLWLVLRGWFGLNCNFT